MHGRIIAMVEGVRFEAKTPMGESQQEMLVKRTKELSKPL